MRTHRVLLPCVIAAVLTCGPAPAEPSKQNTFLQSLSKAGLTFSQTLTGNGAGKGASFSYSKTDSEAGQLSAQFALQYAPYIGDMSQYFGVSVEGNVAQPDAKNTSYLNFRTSYGFWYIVDRSLPYDHPSFYVTTSLLMENTTDFRIKNLMFDTEIQPIYQGLCFYHLCNRSAYVTLELQPSLELQVGGNIAGLAYSTETEATRLRLIPKLGGTIHLPKLATELLHIEDVTISVSDTFDYLPLETTQTYNHFETELNLELIKGIGLGFNWQSGQVAPTYVRSSTFEVRLTVRIGDSKVPK
jgi:hypothetical protein